MSKDKVGTLSKVSKHFYAGNKNVVITSDIWDRDDEYKRLFPQYIPHVGYDYRAAVGTALVTPFSGVVTAVVTSLGSAYGRQVFVYSPAADVTAHFAHLSRVDVKAGQEIKKGTQIGLSGRSGAQENTFAAHLHFGLAKGRLTTAGNKGSKLGDKWLDVELFDFDNLAKPKLKSNEEIAKEVWQGKWGTGADRVNRLTAAGYDAKAVQAIVNKGATAKPTPSKPTNYVGHKWRAKVPLTLRRADGSAYAEPSRTVRDYTILAQNGDLIQIQHAKFNPKVVWVKLSDGTIQ